MSEQNLLVNAIGITPTDTKAITHNMLTLTESSTAVKKSKGGRRKRKEQWTKPSKRRREY